MQYLQQHFDYVIKCVHFQIPYRLFETVTFFTEKAQSFIHVENRHTDLLQG